MRWISDGRKLATSTRARSLRGIHQAFSLAILVSYFVQLSETLAYLHGPHSSPFIDSWSWGLSRIRGLVM